uniref:Uncharacterized protein n=1 Tax=Romanomermis culicivorax TaxID=13658 RepID=A0A915KS22_ROMCU
MNCYAVPPKHCIFQGDPDIGQQSIIVQSRQKPSYFRGINRFKFHAAKKIIGSLKADSYFIRRHSASGK